jgi:hypothetical protein
MRADDARVRSAVRHWERRVGPCTVFDRDDARQEARIAIWKAGERGTSTAGYRQILDALRALVPGFRDQAQPQFVGLEDYDEADDMTPERIAGARQMLRRMQELPDRIRITAERCFAGETCTEIAADMGVTTSEIYQRLKAAQLWLLAAQGVDARPTAQQRAKARERFMDRHDARTYAAS